MAVINRFIAGVQTLDATVTNLQTFTPANNTVTAVKVIVTGRRSDGIQGAMYDLFAVFRKDGAGVIAQVGSTLVVASQEDNVAWDATIDGSAGVIRIRVTGVAVTTIDWAGDSYVFDPSAAGAAIPASGGTGPGVMQWIKVTKSHTDFQAAATTNNIEIYSLAAGAMLHGVVVKHTTAFAGTGITAYTLSVGLTGNLAKYATAFDVFQAIADTTLQASDNFAIENWGAVTSIRGAAVSTGGNLNASTAGAVEFYLLVSQVKT